ISASANSNRRGRFSTRMTREPRMANMHVYSTPITPPPTTISVRGISGISKIWSLLTMVRPLSGTVGLVAGLVPAAMMMLGAPRSLWPREFSTRTCVASRKLVRPGDVDLGLDHLVDAEPQVRHGDLFLDVVVGAVDALVLETREVHHSLSHGLAGDGPGVDAGAADDFALLDHRHAAATLGVLDSRPLAGRSGPDDDDVEFPHEKLRKTFGHR